MNEFSNISKEVISSSSINFFFGAGVNGKAFKMAKDFKKTLDFFKNCLQYEVELEDGFTQVFGDDYLNAKKKFIEEIKEADDDYLKDDSKECCDSKNNINEMLKSVHKIVDKTENRCARMKQINIFTLNYDNVIEDRLNELGFFYNFVSNSNYAKKRNVYDVIGYDIEKQKNIPTYLVSHLHGLMDNPIVPGNEKYASSINSENFEIVYNMKRILMRPNSVLFVIGYSGGDKHFNDIILDAIENGLTVYWLSFNGDVKDIVEKFGDKIFINRGDGVLDSTKILSNILEDVWKN